MASMKGYTVRRTRNYFKNPKTGEWQGHSISVWDSRGYTRKWATLEDAESFVKEDMARMNADCTVDDEGYVKYWKIYQGKECIKTIFAE